MTSRGGESWIASALLRALLAVVAGLIVASVLAGFIGSLGRAPAVAEGRGVEREPVEGEAAPGEPVQEQASPAGAEQPGRSFFWVWAWSSSINVVTGFLAFAAPAYICMLAFGLLLRVWSGLGQWRAVAVSSLVVAFLTILPSQLLFRTWNVPLRVWVSMVVGSAAGLLVMRGLKAAPARPGL
jgi:hypothetical protein